MKDDLKRVTNYINIREREELVEKAKKAAKLSLIIEYLLSESKKNILTLSQALEDTNLVSKAEQYGEAVFTELNNNYIDENSRDYHNQLHWIQISEDNDIDMLAKFYDDLDNIIDESGVVKAEVVEASRRIKSQLMHDCVYAFKGSKKQHEICLKFSNKSKTEIKEICAKKFNLVEDQLEIVFSIFFGDKDSIDSPNGVGSGGANEFASLVYANLIRSQNLGVRLTEVELIRNAVALAATVPFKKFSYIDDLKSNLDNLLYKNRGLGKKIILQLRSEGYVIEKGLQELSDDEILDYYIEEICFEACRLGNRDVGNFATEKTDDFIFSTLAVEAENYKEKSDELDVVKSVFNKDVSAKDRALRISSMVALHSEGGFLYSGAKNKIITIFHFFESKIFPRSVTKEEATKKNESYIGTSLVKGTAERGCEVMAIWVVEALAEHIYGKTLELKFIGSDVANNALKVCESLKKEKGAIGPYTLSMLGFDRDDFREVDIDKKDEVSTQEYYQQSAQEIIEQIENEQDLEVESKVEYQLTAEQKAQLKVRGLSDSIELAKEGVGVGF